MEDVQKAGMSNGYAMSCSIIMSGCATASTAIAEGRVPYMTPQGCFWSNQDLLYNTPYGVDSLLDTQKQIQILCTLLAKWASFDLCQA